MKLKAFKTLFGESILLECENGKKNGPIYDGLLVDRGSFRRYAPRVDFNQTREMGNNMPVRRSPPGNPTLRKTIQAMKKVLPRANSSRNQSHIGSLAGMLTHYHRDHYSLFADLAGVSFTEFYLPYIMFMKVKFPEEEKVENRSVIMEEALSKCLQDAYWGGSFDEDALFILAGQIPLLKQLLAGGKVKVLYQGKHFSVGKTEFEVLWPPRGKPVCGSTGLAEFYAAQETDKLYFLNQAEQHIEKEVENSFFGKMIADFNESYPVNNRDEVRGDARVDFRDFLELLSPDSMEKINPTGDGAKHRWFEVFHNCITHVRSNIMQLQDRINRGGTEGIILPDEKEVERLYVEQIQFLRITSRILSAVPKSNEANISADAEQLSDMFREDNNASSIVFRDYKPGSSFRANTHSVKIPKGSIAYILRHRSLLIPEEECCNYQLLMTGDITKEVVEKYLYASYFQGLVYRCLKCPHHGTRSHYSIMLPASLIMLASNGLGHSEFGEISSAYLANPCLPFGKYNGLRRCISPDCSRCEIGKVGRCSIGVQENWRQQGRSYVEVDLERERNIILIKQE